MWQNPFNNNNNKKRIFYFMHPIIYKLAILAEEILE